MLGEADAADALMALDSLPVGGLDPHHTQTEFRVG